MCSLYFCNIKCAKHGVYNERGGVMAFVQNVR